MNKTTGKKAPPLFLLGNGRRIKNKIINDFLVAEAADRNKHSNNYI